MCSVKVCVQFFLITRSKYPAAMLYELAVSKPKTNGNLLVTAVQLYCAQIQQHLRMRYALNAVYYCTSF